MNGRKEAIIRGVVLAVTLINSILTASGKNPLPFDESAFNEFVAYAINALAALWAWWKNNNITQEAIERDNPGIQ